MKYLLKIIQPIRRFYWWLFRPKTRGIRAVLINKEGLILLVKHSYEEGWYLPGGRVHRNESDLEALKRELQEELGVVMKGQPVLQGVYQNVFEYKRDTIVVFVIKSFSQNAQKHFEIDNSQYFSPDNLPKDVSRGTERRILEWRDGVVASQDW